MKARLRAAVALGGYCTVILSLTTLKAFFQIGYLWNPDNQRARELRLMPLDDLFSGSWFKPAFEYGGNFAFFVPLGILLYVQVGSKLRATIWGLVFSALVETIQYVFSLGRTDIDDLFFNTLGAFFGAWFAQQLGKRLHAFWQWLAIATTAVFIVLVVLGPRLGDPAKVKDLSLYGSAEESLSAQLSTAALPA